MDSPPSQQDRVTKLCDLIRLDQRVEKVAVLCRPGLLTVQIGGQDPFFTHPVDTSRLTSGNLRVYAQEIVDEWEAQRGTT